MPRSCAASGDLVLDGLEVVAAKVLGEFDLDQGAAVVRADGAARAGVEIAHVNDPGQLP